VALAWIAADMELFKASTDVSIGDGARCLFWHDRWLHGGALKLQFPAIFAIATRKSRSVQQELNGGLSMCSLFRIATNEQHYQFTKLWSILQGVVLQDHPDAISWRWTASGVYTMAPTYHCQCQFIGAVAPFRSAKVWKAHTEHKCNPLHGWCYTGRSLLLITWP
jgi:hypothetical protein